MKDFIIPILALALVIFFAVWSDNTYNNKIYHSNDITVTEWVSPDGVHYWYRSSGYQAMLAPRYDNNGELVID